VAHVNRVSPFSALKSRKVGCFNFVTVDLINLYSDDGSEAESSAAKSSLIVSRAASSSVSSSWAIPVSRLLRSRRTFTANSGARTRQQDDSSTNFRKTAQQEPENTTAQPRVTPPSLTPPSIVSEGNESPRPGQPTPNDNELDLVVATNPASPVAATGAVALSDSETRLQSVLKESKVFRMQVGLCQGNAALIQ
jgi:hypothetical protein